MDDDVQKSQTVFCAIELFNVLPIVMENPCGMKVLLWLQIVSYYFETQMKIEAPLLFLFFQPA